jgi:hypothetical protein
LSRAGSEYDESGSGTLARCRALAIEFTSLSRGALLAVTTERYA